MGIFNVKCPTEANVFEYLVYSQQHGFGGRHDGGCRTFRRWGLTRGSGLLGERVSLIDYILSLIPTEVCQCCGLGLPTSSAMEGVTMSSLP